MKQKAVTLSELNELVEDTLKLSIEQGIWIVAELSEVRTARGGHCYLEFIEKEDNSGRLIAKARGTIWNSTFLLLQPYFEEQTGQAFVAGLKVLVQVDVNFHKLYGYSLNVINIDPSYTLGDAAKRRHEILNQLKEEGVLEMNKGLVLPKILRNIAVISSPTAAGYGDFCNEIEKEGYGLDFYLQLFPAVMQGEKVESTIINALDKILETEKEWDAIVIIRGGGAVSDLHGYESYILAASIAQYPLPILTGIGHERDNTVIDLVANTRFKTPTAVADFLVTTRKDEIQRFENLCDNFKDVVNSKLEKEQQRLNRIIASTLHLSDRFSALEKNKILQKLQRIELAIDHLFYNNGNFLERTKMRLQQQCATLFMQQQHRLNLLQQLIESNNPAHLFKRGFSITLKDGKVVTDTSDVKEGEHLTTILANGKIESKINHITKEK